MLEIAVKSGTAKFDKLSAIFDEILADGGVPALFAEVSSKGGRGAFVLHHGLGPANINDKRSGAIRHNFIKALEKSGIREEYEKLEKAQIVYYDFLQHIKKLQKRYKSNDKVLERLGEEAKKESFNMTWGLSPRNVQTALKHCGFTFEDWKKLASFYPTGSKRGRNEKAFFEALKEYVETKGVGGIEIKSNKVIIDNLDVDIYMNDNGNKYGILWDGRFHLKPMKVKEDKPLKSRIDSLYKFINANETAIKKIRLFPTQGVKVYIIEDNTKRKSDIVKYQVRLFIDAFKSGRLKHLGDGEEYIKILQGRIDEVRPEYNRLLALRNKEKEKSTSLEKKKAPN